MDLDCDAVYLLMLERMVLSPLMLVLFEMSVDFAYYFIGRLLLYCCSNITTAMKSFFHIEGRLESDSHAVPDRAGKILHCTCRFAVVWEQHVWKYCEYFLFYFILL